MSIMDSPWAVSSAIAVVVVWQSWPMAGYSECRTLATERAFLLTVLYFLPTSAALIILLLVNFGLCLSRLCLVFGMLSGIVTSLITIMQYIFFVKTSFASHFGPKQKRPHYTEQLSLVNSLRWSIGSLAKCSTCVQSELHGGLSNKVTATSA